MFPLYIYASSGIVRAFDTHTASVRAYTHDDRVPCDCRETFQQARLILSSRRCAYARTWMSMALCVAHAHRKRQTRGDVGYLSGLLYRNRCLLLRGPGDALSRFRLRFSNFRLSLPPPPPSPRDGSSRRYSRRNVFRPFCHVIGHWPYPRRSSGVESTRRSSSDDEATASFPSHFFLSLSFSLSLSFFPFFFSTEDNTFEPTKR